MDRQIIAIGGGGFGRHPGVGIIEKYILQQSDKEKPNICFIPTATGDSDSYKVSYYTTLNKLNCNPTHLDFFKRTPNLEELIKNQDIIFVGGGNTKSMLSVWKEWGLDTILKKAYLEGTIMSGVSAGAICWFEKGVTDSWADELNVMECLSFTKGNCCPHYDEESERKPSLSQFIKEGLLKDCYAIDGGCALHVKNDELYKAISFMDDKNSFLVKKENGEIKEEPLSKISIS
jgi:aminopeptidase N